jgi:beta-lactamase regulating signal transducer with metallopeptidase domain
MKLSGQRFLWLVAATLALQATLAVAAALPVVADAAVEGAHRLVRNCTHPFTPHYENPLTALAAVLIAVAAIGVVAYVQACRQIAAQTDAAVRPILPLAVAPLPARLTAITDRCRLTAHVTLLASPYPLAFCHGMRRPRVYVTTGLCTLLADDELHAVLLHEDRHRRRREPLRLMLLGGLCRLLGFWGAMPAALAAARIEMEIAADAEVVRRTGGRGPLARALWKVLHHAPAAAGNEVWHAVSTLSATAARIEGLLRPGGAGPAPLPWTLLGRLGIASVSLGAGLLAFATGIDLHLVLGHCGVG